MDRSVVAEVRRLLAAGSGGGVAESQTRLNRAELAAVAAEHAALFAELDGPASKAELIEALRAALVVPAYTGGNWDALEEVLAYPERNAAGPSLVAWRDPRRLPNGEAATFKAIVEAAAATRASTGDPPLVVVAGPG